MMKKARDLCSPVIIGLLAATMLTSNEATARRLLPSQPSVEVRLEALRVLERAVAAENMALQAAPVVAQNAPSQPVIPFKPASAYVPPYAPSTPAQAAPIAPTPTPAPIIKEVTAPIIPPPAPPVSVAPAPIPTPAPAAPVVEAEPTPAPQPIVEKEEKVVIEEVAPAPIPTPEPIAITTPEIKEETPPLEVVEEKMQQQPEEVTKEVDLDAILAEEETSAPIAPQEVIAEKAPPAEPVIKEEMPPLEVTEPTKEEAEPAETEKEEPVIEEITPVEPEIKESATQEAPPPSVPEKTEELPEEKTSIESLPEPEIPETEPDFEALETTIETQEKSALPELPPVEETAALPEIPTEEATPAEKEPLPLEEVKKEETPAPEAVEESLPPLTELPDAPTPPAAPQEEEVAIDDAIAELGTDEESIPEDAPIDAPPAIAEDDAPSMEIPEEEVVDEAAIEEIMQEETPEKEVAPKEEKEAKAEEPLTPELTDTTEEAPADTEQANDAAPEQSVEEKAEDVPVAMAPQEEKPTGWLPSLSKGFASFLGGKKEPAKEQLAKESVKDAPPVAASAPAEEIKAEKAPSPQEKSLPNLPDFDNAAKGEAKTAESLPNLPDFGATTPATSSIADSDAPLPDLPFDDGEKEAAQKAMAAPADKEIAIASLPKEEAAALESAPAAPLTKGKALSVIFSQAETEVPLSSQQPLVELSKKLASDAGAQVKIIAYASGSKDQASIARRISLARALAVRALLIDLGVDNVRISVQAMGNNIPDGESERADIVLSD